MIKKSNFFVISIFLLIVLSNVGLAQQGTQVAPQIVSNATTVTTTTTSSQNWFSGKGCMEISLAPFLPSCPQTPADYLSGLYRLALYAAVIAAIIQISIAGFIYATSGDSSSKQKEAKDQIRDAIIGLILIISSVLILRTINPDLVKLNVPGIQPKLSDKELKQREEEEIQKTNEELRKTCVNEICSKFSGENLKKCLQACDDLYKVTITDPAACYQQCYNKKTLENAVMIKNVGQPILDAIIEECAIECKYYEALDLLKK